jgi:predicted nucleic acid-binding protein
VRNVADSGGPLCFFDTKAVAKLYHEEPRSEVMEALASSSEAELWIAELTRAEFYSVCLRKLRKGELAEEAR